MNQHLIFSKNHFQEKKGESVESVIGFSSEFKYSGVNFKNESFVLGPRLRLLEEIDLQESFQWQRRPSLGRFLLRVLFKAGDQICADAVIVKGEVSVNESLLTGEEDEIQKKENAELLSGSFVISGSCYARLSKVGKDSYISKLTFEWFQLKYWQ